MYREDAHENDKLRHHKKHRIREIEEQVCYIYFYNLNYSLKRNERK